MPRKVFQGAVQPHRVVTGNERQCLRRDDGRVRREGSVQRTDDRVVGIDIEIDHGGQVQVDSDAAQRLGDTLPALLGVRRVVAQSERRR